MLVIGIKKKDEILLSQTSVALPGFVDATQLVFMVAVPQIKEVVPQVEPVVLIKSRLRVRTEVISMIEDITHFPNDLIWDDKIEDETIVNLVRGLSAAVLTRMRAEKKQKEKEAKEKNERESQPVFKF
ncbi:unnamed protein product [Brassica rapa]|uniref:Uncharacterized protein n=1 Tax=Brassica campestris TaxID=3711 RepID=A0A3P6ABJ5_BRACM|nr:unnamed protein product [Brassica rapa]VDC82540.1 unnamed protein product [Brassica rapa]